MQSLCLEQLYKAQAPKLLATLTGILGTHNFDLAEDVLQEAFGKAASQWPQQGAPDNPAGWLLKTAKNAAIDIIRKHKTHTRFAPQLTHQLSSEWTVNAVLERVFEPEYMQDEQLKLIFVCCDPSIQASNRIPFVLRHLCGFSIAAICRALLLTPEVVKKRLQRTKQQIAPLSFEFPPVEAILMALNSVHTVLYLLFNEGFYCSDEQQAVKKELCAEAIGLNQLLLHDPDIANQDTYALMALMHFHIARLKTRCDAQGELIALNKQNRRAWHQGYIATGQRMLALARRLPQANGRFFIEAQIAQQHCMTDCFEQTDWQRIVKLYDELIALTNSPVARLNQSIAMGYAGELQQAVEQMHTLIQHPALAHSFMPAATLAHLYARQGKAEQACKQAERAKQLGGTASEHRMMQQQLADILTSDSS